MRQNKNTRSQEIISMEEYLKRRQAKKRAEGLNEPAGQRRAAQWNAALEIAQLYV